MNQHYNFLIIYQKSKKGVRITHQRLADAMEPKPSDNQNSCCHAFFPRGKSVISKLTSLHRVSGIPVPKRPDMLFMGLSI